MSGKTPEIGCVIMASGLSERYGRDKLLEKLNGREIVLHTADSLMAAGFRPLVVTRSKTVLDLMERSGIRCILHDGSLKSDTIHTGLRNLETNPAGYLFMPGDQPLVRPDSLRKMVRHFLASPDRAVRLGFNSVAGSPVLFPASCRDKLMAYTGDRGGVEVLRMEQIPCDVVQAAFEWELWDVDTPESMEKVRKQRRSFNDQGCFL